MTRDLGAGLAAFGVLVACAAPGLGWFDSGELIAAGLHLGVSHPPGQPAWTLLARAAACLPLGSLAFRMTLLSCLSGGVTVLLALRLLRLLTGGRGGPAPAFCAVAVAAHPMLLEQTLRAEVYAPSLALLLLALLAVLHAGRPTAGGADPRWLGTAAVAGGLLLALHPLVGGVAGLAAAAWLAGVLWPRGGWSRLVAAAPLAGVGLLAYALLPVRTTSGAAFAWGRPDTLDRFLDVVTAAAYRGNFAMAGTRTPSLLDRLLGHADLTLAALGPSVALLAFAGLVGGLIRRPLESLLLAGVAAAALATSVSQRVFHPENPDVHGYLAICVVAALLAAAAAIAALWHGLAARPRLRHLSAPCFVALGVLPLLGWDGAPVAGGVHLPRVVAQEAIARVPAHGSLLASSDHVAFGALYLQRVEGARPDLALAIEPLFLSSWHLLARKAAGRQRFVPWVEDGDARAGVARYAAQAGCADGVDGTCRVEDPAHLPPAARPGRFLGLTYAPGPGPGSGRLDRLAALAGTTPEDPVLRYHARLRALHLAGAGDLDGAIRILARALGLADPLLGPTVGPKAPLQYPTLPRLARIFVSSASDLRALLADALAASGRLAAAIPLWSGPSADDPTIGLSAVRHLYLAGRPKASRAAYDRLLTTHPDQRPHILYNLGVFFAREGAPRAASEQLSTLVEEAPDHPLAPRARRYLERLAQEDLP